MTTPTPESVKALADGLVGAHRHLADSVSRRWIAGTGFCHASVGRDLEAIGLVESRLHHGRRQIRATPMGLAVQAHLGASHA